MLEKFQKVLRRLNPVTAFRKMLFVLANWRRGRFKKLDYILLTLPETMPPLPEHRSLIQRYILHSTPPFNLAEFDRILEQIANDPRPQGIVLILRSLSMSLADLQTLRGSIIRFKERGKKIVFYGQDYNNACYFIASAGDKILMQPGGELNTIGLREQAVFLRDALDTLGVSLDSVAISPYKGAFDRFTRDTISPEGQKQLEWLLDSRYQIILEGIAEGRKLTLESVQHMIDSAPHLDKDALAAGYIDGILNEENLPEYLSQMYPHQQKTADDKATPPNILTWKEASKVLLKQWRKSSDQYVALLKVSGLMVPGESGKPPGNIPLPIPFIGSDRAGDVTVVRQVRNLLKHKEVAAVILFVDSGGGSAAAAEAMTSALNQLAQDRPVVAFMNSIAASGGYYICTAASWIVAQPGTITGSIGVISGKPVTNGIFERLRANRLEFTRGANATIFSDATPFTDAQRDRVRQSIEHIYQQFIARVANSRRLSLEAVDAVGGGRVWTGAQAQAHGLVDELGDLRAALVKARELANLPEHAPLVVFEGKAKPLPPQVLEQANPAAWLRYMYDNLRAVANGSAQVLTPIEWE